MSSARYRRPLALTLWYSTLFVVGAIVIVFLTYVLTAASLAQRDQQIIQAKLGDYAAVYSRGGLRSFAAAASADLRSGRVRLFVRVVFSGSAAIVRSDCQE